MIKIEYIVGTRTVETHYKPTMAIAKWFTKQLKDTHRLGTFKFSRV